MKRLWNALVTGVTGAFLLVVLLWVAVDPEIPSAWNPLAPFDLNDERNVWTQAKLRRSLSSDDRCLAALDRYADFERMVPLVADEGCGIDPRIRLNAVGTVALAPVETTCAVALRLAAWERFVLQAEASTHLGSGVAALRHQSSYSCRAIRTESGPGTRLSTHATAEAIDIAGVWLTDGRQLELSDNWQGESAEARFFRAIHAGACEWFVTVLGPDFNALHEDHFHLQSVGWGSCR